MKKKCNMDYSPSNIGIASLAVSGSTYCPTISFGDCVTYSSMAVMPCNQEKANTMTPRDDADKARYLLSRLYDVQYAKKEEAKTTFGLSDDPFPTGAKALVDAITAGMYILPTDPEDKHYTMIRFRDPKKVEDKAGYKTFKEALTKQYEIAKDRISIQQPEEALKTFEAFRDAAIQ